MSSYVPTDVGHPLAKSRSIFQYVPYQRVGLFTALTDFALVLSTSVAAGIVYHAVLFESEGNVAAYSAIGVYSGLIFVMVSKILGLYQPNSLLSLNSQVRGVLLAWSMVLLFLTSVFFLFKSGANYSRGSTIGFCAIGFLSVITARVIIGSNLKRALASGTLAGRRVVVIGDAAELAAKSALYLLRSYGTREVSRFQVSPTTGGGRSAISQDLGTINAAIRSAQAHKAEQILLALSWADAWRRDLICERLRVLPLPVLLLPDRSVNSVLSDTASSHSAVAPLEVQRAPLSVQDLFLKRAFDVVLASLGLVALSPLLLFTAIAIKLDSPGPVIFRQRRRGFSGREFAIFKFRSMSVMEDGPCIQQAKRGDERVTRIGRLLRSTSIDELPQLLNVLSGDMSLIGPRPHAIAHDDEYSNSIDNYAFRHHVKPGITGWAQMHGFRGETADVAAMKNRIQLDLWYINNWNFWLDFRIMGRTFIELLRSTNAY